MNTVLSGSSFQVSDTWALSTTGHRGGRARPRIWRSLWNSTWLGERARECQNFGGLGWEIACDAHVAFSSVENYSYSLPWPWLEKDENVKKRSFYAITQRLFKWNNDYGVVAKLVSFLPYAHVGMSFRFSKHSEFWSHFVHMFLDPQNAWISYHRKER